MKLTKAPLALVRQLPRYVGSYLVGIALASSIASIAGGSMLLLIFYSLVVGLPFFVVALLVGFLCRRSVAAHPVAWSLAVPVVTAVIWFSLDLTTGDLFNPTRVALYATFCAAMCGAVFLATTYFWPFR